MRNEKIEWTFHLRARSLRQRWGFHVDVHVDVRFHVRFRFQEADDDA